MFNRVKARKFFSGLQLAAEASKVNSFTEKVIHVWKRAFIRGVQLTAMRNLSVESLTGRLSSTLNFTVFRHIRAVFIKIKEFDGITAEHMRF